MSHMYNVRAANGQFISRKQAMARKHARKLARDAQGHFLPKQSGYNGGSDILAAIKQLTAAVESIQRTLAPEAAPQADDPITPPAAPVEDAVADGNSVVTADMLRNAGLSGPGLDQFTNIFPNGMEVTEENLVTVLNGVDRQYVAMVPNSGLLTEEASAKLTELLSATTDDECGDNVDQTEIDDALASIDNAKDYLSNISSFTGDVDEAITKAFDAIDELVSAVESVDVTSEEPLSNEEIAGRFFDEVCGDIIK